MRSWVRTPGTSVLSTIMISRDCRTPRGSLARPPFRPSFRPPARSMPATSPASSHPYASWTCAFVRAAGEAPHTAQPAATATATATNGSEEVQTSCGAGAGTGGGGGPAKKVKVKEENKDVACCHVSLSHSLFGAEASVLVVVRIHGGCLAHTVFATQRQQRHESQRMVSELPVRSQRLSLMWLYSPQNLTRKDVFHTTTASLCVSAPAARWPCAPCPSGGGGAVPCVGYQPLVAGGC